jgi:iron complex transport system substrate-binding protein
MKKIISALLCAAILSLAAVQLAAAPSTVSVTHSLGVTEAPYDPQRIAALDLAALDLLDALGFGGRVTAMPKASSVSYLTRYTDDKNIVGVGSVKEIDMESLNASAPDLIFIGGRLASEYENIYRIAPAICFGIDNAKGYMDSFRANVAEISSIFGQTERAGELLKGFDERLEAVRKLSAGKTAIVGIVTGGALSTLGNKGRCSLIGREAGFTNLAADIDSAHGNNASFEILLEKNPDYIFILDRDTAINARGAKTAKEVMENEIVMKTDAYKNGNIVYLTPDVWYLSEGGIRATDTMIADIEKGFSPDSKN